MSDNNKIGKSQIISLRKELNKNQTFNTTDFKNIKNIWFDLKNNKFFFRK